MKKVETHGDPSGQSGNRCKCGCGLNARLGRLYVQGHDAKHVAKLFRAVAADKLDVADAMLVLRETPVLAAKLFAQIQRNMK